LGEFSPNTGLQPKGSLFGCNPAADNITVNLTLMSQYSDSIFEWRVVSEKRGLMIRLRNSGQPTFFLMIFLVLFISVPFQSAFAADVPGQKTYNNLN
jgi:hypothetical protein